MPAIFADQRLSQPIRWNRHVLFRIAQLRALSVGLVNIVIRRRVMQSSARVVGGFSGSKPNDSLSDGDRLPVDVRVASRPGIVQNRPVVDGYVDEIAARVDFRCPGVPNKLRWHRISGIGGVAIVGLRQCNTVDIDDANPKTAPTQQRYVDMAKVGVRCLEGNYDLIPIALLHGLAAS